MRRLFATLALLAAGGCGDAIRITRLPTDDAEALAVRIAFPQPPLINVARVDASGAYGDIVWQLVPRRDTTQALPLVVRYGSVPPGYAEAAPAQALTPGRYVLYAAYTDARGEYPFQVAADGRVR